MAKKGKILIIDDNNDLLIAFKLFLSPHFQEIKTVRNPNTIFSVLENETFDVILLDMNFTAGVNTGNEGIFWMRKILEKDKDAIIVLITAYGDVELAVKTMKEGAIDFIQKSWDEEKILSTILSAYKFRQSKLEINKLKNKQKHLSEKTSKAPNICFGHSEQMQELFSTLDKVAKTDANVLIIGENGTGKEVVAEYLHRNSERADEIFVTVDVAALNENLFESELFGHTKGAFTDAKTDRAGRFEIATGGTLFLDEIGNLSPAMQSKLLTVLQNRVIYKLGSNIPIPVDIRLICATNKPLYEMVDNGEFREDLLYRINTISVEIPPLRERKEDIPALVDFFIEQYQTKYHKQNVEISKNALIKLKKHTWNGNVRELKHVIEKAVILADSNILQPEDFFFRESHENQRNAVQTFDLAENEKELIKLALRKFSGNLKETATQLGISRSTLYAKIEKYGL